MNGIRDIKLAPLIVGVGCQQATIDAPLPPAPLPAVVVDAPAPPQVKVIEEPKPLGKFSITFYYVVGEEEVAPKKAPPPAAANDNQSTEGEAELAAIAAPPEQMSIFTTTNGKACEPIAEVSREFANQLAIQGTGKLRDGRVLNVWGHCSCKFSPCFKVTSATWGTAGSGRQLHPFRTVAVDPKVIKLGSLLYVPLLEGRQMPGRAPWGGFVHDGCVVADDVGGGIKGNQLDLFVGRKGWFLGISGSGGSHAWARHVPVFDGAKRCERKGRHVARKAGAI